jgi:hypothetical protein
MQLIFNPSDKKMPNQPSKVLSKRMRIENTIYPNECHTYEDFVAYFEQFTLITVREKFEQGLCSYYDRAAGEANPKSPLSGKVKEYKETTHKVKTQLKGLIDYRFMRCETTEFTLEGNNIYISNNPKQPRDHAIQLSHSLGYILEQIKNSDANSWQLNDVQFDGEKAYIIVSDKSNESYAIDLSALDPIMLEKIKKIANNKHLLPQAKAIEFKALFQPSSLNSKLSKENIDKIYKTPCAIFHTSPTRDLKDKEVLIPNTDKPLLVLCSPDGGVIFGDDDQDVSNLRNNLPIDLYKLINFNLNSLNLTDNKTSEKISHKQQILTILKKLHEEAKSNTGIADFNFKQDSSPAENIFAYAHDFFLSRFCSDEDNNANDFLTTNFAEFLHDDMADCVEKDDAYLKMIGSMSMFDFIAKITMDAMLGSKNNPFRHGPDSKNPGYDHSQAFSKGTLVFDNTASLMNYWIKDVYRDSAKGYIFEDHPVRFFLNDGTIFKALNARDGGKYDYKKEAIYAINRQNLLKISIIDMLLSSKPSVSSDNVISYPRYDDYVQILIDNQNKHIEFSNYCLLKDKNKNEGIISANDKKDKEKNAFIISANDKYAALLKSIQKEMEHNIRNNPSDLATKLTDLRKQIYDNINKEHSLKTSDTNGPHGP